MANHTITVTVDSARGLRAADITGTSDPYALVYLGDHRGKRRGQAQKTATIKHTLNPSWNSTFTFHVSERELSSSSLVVKIMDYDRFTRDDKLGFFVTPLSKLMATPYQDNWFPLTKSLSSNLPAQGNVHLIISVDGHQKPGMGTLPAGAAAPYQPQYAAQPAYMGGGFQSQPQQQQPSYMGSGAYPQQMQQQQMQQQQAGKYPGLGSTGSSFTAPPPAQAYPPPAAMPGYAQPPAGGPSMMGYAGAPGAFQAGGFGQQPPAAGYPQQAAQQPYGPPPSMGGMMGPPPQQQQPPFQPQQQQQGSGLAAPAAYIPGFRP